jgi:hypothetical protein
VERTWQIQRCWGAMTLLPLNNFESSIFRWLRPRTHIMPSCGILYKIQDPPLKKEPVGKTVMLISYILSFQAFSIFALRPTYSKNLLSPNFTKTNTLSKNRFHAFFFFYTFLTNSFFLYSDSYIKNCIFTPQIHPLCIKNCVFTLQIHRYTVPVGFPFGT